MTLLFLACADAVDPLAPPDPSGCTEHIVNTSALGSPYSESSRLWHDPDGNYERWTEHVEGFYDRELTQTWDDTECAIRTEGTFTYLLDGELEETDMSRTCDEFGNVLTASGVEDGFTTAWDCAYTYAGDHAATADCTYQRNGSEHEVHVDETWEGDHRVVRRTEMDGEFDSEETWAWDEDDLVENTLSEEEDGEDRESLRWTYDEHHRETSETYEGPDGGDVTTYESPVEESWVWRQVRTTTIPGDVNITWRQTCTSWPWDCAGQQDDAQDGLVDWTFTRTWTCD